MGFFGAEAGSFNETGIAAIIAAISGLVVAVFGGLFQVIKYGGDRVDKSTAGSLRTMADARDDALAGEKAALEREAAAVAREHAANERADRWQEMWQTEQRRANALEVKLATRDPSAGA